MNVVGQDFESRRQNGRLQCSPTGNRFIRIHCSGQVLASQDFRQLSFEATNTSGTSDNFDDTQVSSRQFGFFQALFDGSLQTIQQRFAQRFVFGCFQGNVEIEIILEHFQVDADFLDALGTQRFLGLFSRRQNLDACFGFFHRFSRKLASILFFEFLSNPVSNGQIEITASQVGITVASKHLQLSWFKRSNRRRVGRSSHIQKHDISGLFSCEFFS